MIWLFACLVDGRTGCLTDWLPDVLVQAQQHKAERQARKVGDLQSALSDHRPLAKQLSLAFQELHGMNIEREADRSRIAALLREVRVLFLNMKFIIFVIIFEHLILSVLYV